jgi:hypothetical protein
MTPSNVEPTAVAQAVEPASQPATGMLGTVVEWSQAAEKGGPWFITAVIGLVLVVLVRFFLSREKELRAQIDALNKAAVDREKACTESTSEALAEQAKLFQERYDALREESREEHRKRNDEVREVAVTMTAAIANDLAAKHAMTKSFDDVKSELNRLSVEVRDFVIKKR